MSTDTAHAKPGQLTAMISSTALDLEKHRPAVEAACIAAGIFPIWMKHVPARDADGVKVSLEMVDQADLYIGVYAWRYGWVPKGGEKSITELEFDHALQRQADGKLHELLIFTAHKSHPLTVEDIETDATAQAKLAAFKTRACEGRGKKDFSSVEELQRVVSDALHHFLQRQQAKQGAASAEDKSTAAGPAPAPLTTSRASTTSTGAKRNSRKSTMPSARKAHLGRAHCRARGHGQDLPGRPRRLRIHARTVRPRHLRLHERPRPRGRRTARRQSPLRLPLSRHPRRTRPRTRPRRHPPSPPEDRARLLLDALAGTRALLILDNLESLTPEDRERIVEFVSDLPGGCKAILTTRRRIGRGIESHRSTSSTKPPRSRPLPTSPSTTTCSTRQRRRASQVVEGNRRQPAPPPLDGRPVRPRRLPHLRRCARLPPLLPGE